MGGTFSEPSGELKKKKAHLEWLILMNTTPHSTASCSPVAPTGSSPFQWPTVSISQLRPARGEGSKEALEPLPQLRSGHARGGLPPYSRGGQSRRFR